MRLTARSIVLSILFSIFYFLFSISPVAAQTNSANLKQVNSYNPYLNPNTNPDVPKNLHTWTQNVMIEVMSAMTCQLTGIDPTMPKGKCLGVDPKSGNIGFVEGGGGAIGMTGKMIAMLYTPPLHTVDYFKYLANNFGIAKPAHAQVATGFEGLKPIQGLWIAFRDVVYLLFVIIFIVIGLAIMLRVRIDPRTVMTIQNQIPRIIIGLLILTFSFAIAGFLIDLMYVAIFLSYEVIVSTVSNGVTIFSDLNPLSLQNKTPLEAADKIKNWGVSGIGLFGITFEAAAAIYSIVSNLLGDLVEDFTKGILTSPIGLFGWIPVIGDDIAGFIGNIFGLVAGDIMGFFASAIAFLIIAIALLIALIRLWFVLIITYVSILLDVVFAPFWIAASLLPGSPIGFGAWLRSIISNLAAFPAVIIMFLLAKVFIDGFGQSSTDTDFVPPLIGNISGTDTIGALIGLGFILMTPNVVSLVKAALRAPRVGIGPTIIGAVAGGMGAPGGILATAGHLGGALFGISHLAAVIPGLKRIRGGQPTP